MSFAAQETLREAPERQSPRGRGWLVLFVAVLAVAAVVFVRRPSREAGWDTQRLTAQLFYVSIAPPPLSSIRPADAPISILRLHYFVRNNGGKEYRFDRDVSLMERNGVALAPASTASSELPPGIAPAQQSEVVITKPYRGELLTGEQWRRLYPNSELTTSNPEGRYPRLMLPVDAANGVMEKLSLTPAALVAKFDVIGDGPARECTMLAGAILRRKFPRLTGFALLDPATRVRIEFPLPRG